MKENQLWKFILEKLMTGERVVLLVVVDFEKGSPGKTGFKLALTADKKFVGTIGGGVMEYSILEQYAAQLQSGKVIRDLRMLVHSPTTSRGELSGLACAGSQTMCAVSLDENDIFTVRSIHAALVEHLPARMIFTEDGFFFDEGKKSNHSTFKQTSSVQWRYEENIGPEYTIYVIGGGHVGNALSRILATLDFYIVVYDEREDLQLLKENAFAHKKIIAPYSQLAQHITEPQKSFAAIVTSNSNSDTVVLQQVLPLHLPYVGLMGAEAKIARVKKSLDEAERKEFLRQHIHSPIGIQIESRTVEEIAISIAAEIIAVKNSNLN